MGNLFEISNKLQDVINTIEENGGVITPEIEAELNISEENLKEKLNDYSNLISQLKYDVENCSAEIKRITELKRSKQKLIDRLSGMVIDAIDTFGIENKNKVKYIDLGTKKLSIRNNQSCDVDTDYVDFVNDRFVKFLNEMKNHNGLGDYSFTDDFLRDMDGGLSESDLENTKLNIIIKKPIKEITDNNDELLSEIIEKFDCDLVFDVNKSECKSILNSGVELSYAKLEPTKSLITK